MGDQAAGNVWFPYAKQCMHKLLHTYRLKKVQVGIAAKSPVNHDIVGKSMMVSAADKRVENLTKWYSPKDGVKVCVRMIAGQPQAWIYTGGICITLCNLYDDPAQKRFAFTTQKTFKAGTPRKSNWAGFNYWVNRGKTSCVSSGAVCVVFNGHGYYGLPLESGEQLESVCLVPPAEKSRLISVIGGGYTEYCYAVISGNATPGKLALLLLYKNGDGRYVTDYATLPLPTPWVTSELSALSQWHDSGEYLLKSYFSYDKDFQLNTDKTSRHSIVVGAVDETTKKANGVIIAKYTPSYSGETGLGASQEGFLGYLLYDQIMLTNNVGTEVSSGINTSEYDNFPGCVKPSYILPLGLEQDALSFYVTEVTKAEYSNTDSTGEGGEHIQTVAYDYNVNASMPVIDVTTGGLIDKIPFKTGINKHVLMTTTSYPDPPFHPARPTVTTEVIDMNFVTPLYMNTLFKVFLYLKSTSTSDRVLINSEVSSGAIIKTQDLYIMYNGEEHLVTTGIVKNINFKFEGELIVDKSRGGDRIELYPDVSMFPHLNYGHYGNLYFFNGMGTYGADFKNELIISLNRNQQTLGLGNSNDDDSTIELLAQRSWLFQKKLNNPEEKDKYSYGVDKFITELKDESTSYYADSVIHNPNSSTPWGISVRNLGPSVTNI